MINMTCLEKKIPPPLVALLFGFLMWLLAPFTPTLNFGDSNQLVLALLLTGLGLALDLIALITFFTAKTTINPLAPHNTTRLVTQGIYRFTRNPMYLGSCLFLAAWACFLSAPLTILGICGFVLYINHLQIKPEEAALSALFGDQYSEYKRRVRRWI